MDPSLVILSLLGTANLVALGVLILRGEGRVRSRLARLRARMDGESVPAAVSDLAGVLLHRNPAMAALRGGSPASLAQLFDGVIEEADPSLYYRLARTAREKGVAAEPVTRLLPRPEPAHLLVQSMGDKILTWGLLPPAQFGALLRERPGDNHESAPFAYARTRSAAPPATNAFFRQLFGEQPDRHREVVETVADLGGRRVALPDRHGTPRVFRAVSTADGDVREHFIFPLDRAEDERAGAAAMLEVVPVALAEFDLDGNLLWLNGHARSALHRPERLGAPMAELFEPLGQPLRALLESAAGATEAAPVAEMVRLPGQDSVLQLALSPVEIGGRRTLLAVLTDASELRRLEEKFAQSQKMEAVGKLAGGVAHDFNNLLTAISGHCDLLLLRKDPSDPDYSDLMQVTQNANRAAALVRQLLAFSRKQTLTPRTLDIRDVVTDLRYLLDRLVGETVTIRLEIAARLWPVRADAQQLEQALMNLIVNARDAMGGRGAITIKAHNLRHAAPERRNGTTMPAGDFVEIVVGDTGPGIPEDVIGRVFDPFFTTKPKGEGTGLGLSTVYGIVKQSGGYIAAENAEEGGALFRIRLPRDETAAEDAVESPAPAPEAGGMVPRDLTGSGAILLVEDEAPVRAFAARALRLRGYEVHEAEDAEAAMDILADRECRIDLLISDVVMPGMDGPTFAAEARRLRPGLRLLFVSGYAEESFRKNLTETDFSFLPKPFSLNDLTVRVKEVLVEGAGA